MEKQRTVNTVTANDKFSSELMEAYGRWMGGDTFQDSTIKEEEIPTGQKQGGGNSGTFVSVNGALPAVEFDSSTGLPVIDKENTDDGSKKDPKASSTGGEPPTNPQGLKPKYGQQVRDVTLVGANEETKKAKKDYDGDGKVESGKDEYFGSRDKAIKKAMGKKAMKKEETVLERQEIEVDGEIIIIEKVKMDGVDDNGNTSCWKGYKKMGTKKKGGKEVNNCVKAGFEPEGEEIQEEEEMSILDTKEWKEAARKQTSRIMDMWKEGSCSEGYGKKKKKMSKGY
tara:strand:- start:2993 stop:3841 length:849 start_codon:yes stop_codon:yes gene_type:complete